MSANFESRKPSSNFHQSAVIVLNGKAVGRISLYSNALSKADLEYLTGSNITQLLTAEGVEFETPRENTGISENLFAK